MNENHVSQENKTEASLRASIRDGVSHAAMLGAGETYLGPLGIYLQATAFQLGILSSLPQLFGAAIQWVSAQAMDRIRSRRRLIVTGSVFQALLWIPICLLPVAWGAGTRSVLCLIGLVMLYYGTNGMIVPVWNSLIGDLVPPTVRGSFFGGRSRLTGISTFLALVCAGAVLSGFERGSLLQWGYFAIFLAACLAKLNSARWLVRHEDPPAQFSPEQVFTFRQFIRRSPHSNFAKFVFFVGGINLGVAFSGPFFALYMLRDLKLPYLEFTMVTAVMVIIQFLTFKSWGRLSDRFGNKKILNLCGWGVCIVPVLWLFSPKLLYLLAIQAFSGFTWAGFSLASTNFIFDAVTPPKRARCVAYQGLVNGFCAFLGSLAGGYLAGHLPRELAVGAWIWKPSSVLLFIFLISGLMRLIAAAVFLPRFKEVRPVEPIRHRELIFRISQIRPIAGATFSLFTGHFRGKKSRSDSGAGDRSDAKDVTGAARVPDSDSS
jgi:MFS family permease